MAKTKKPIIDKYFTLLSGISNLHKACVATQDGFMLNSKGFSDAQNKRIPPVLSKYFAELRELSHLTEESRFRIGYYLTETGFMVIASLGEDAVLQAVCSGRENTGQVLRLVQQLAADYEAE